MTNIALVVLDTLRKDYFDRYFDWLPGRRFEQAYSTANWTTPAHASLFTGMYSSEVGVHAKNINFNCERMSIVERLSAEGYQTRAISANPNISPSFNFDRGFKEFNSLTTPDFLNKYKSEEIYDWSKFSQNTSKSGLLKYITGVYRCIRSSAQTLPSIRLGINKTRSDSIKYGGGVEALDLLKDMSFTDNEFLYLNIMEAHEPYKTPLSYREDTPALTNSIGDLKLAGEIPAEEVQEAYDACAQYLSDIYRKIYNNIREDFDYIITLSDHGELLGESGGWAHEYGLHPRLTHIPLCISHSDVTGENTTATSLLDVHQTIAALTGLDIDSNGRHLLDSTSPTFTPEYLSEYHGLTPWSENSVRQNYDKSTYNSYDNKLFAYVSEEYAYETQNEIKFEKNKGNIKKRVINKKIKELKQKRDTRSNKKDVNIPKEVEEKLSDLGYV